jgi:tetratricopeptide (TPR) repeat protein
MAIPSSRNPPHCTPCRRLFKDFTVLQAHLRSKKHTERVAVLARNRPLQRGSVLCEACQAHIPDQHFARHLFSPRHLQAAEYSEWEASSRGGSLSRVEVIPPVDEDADLNGGERLERAVQRKEEGNAAYSKGNYAAATRLYTRSIDLDPDNPLYLLNRAASLMGSKLYSSALDDCRDANALQASQPQAKTLLRTAKCQLALGFVGLARQTLQEASRLAPSDAGVAAEQARVEKVATHLASVRVSLEKEEWSMALSGVNAAVLESGAGEVPIEWEMWKLEALIGKKQYEEASSLAVYVFPLLVLPFSRTNLLPSQGPPPSRPEAPWASLLPCSLPLPFRQHRAVPQARSRSPAKRS